MSKVELAILDMRGKEEKKYLRGYIHQETEDSDGKKQTSTIVNNNCSPWKPRNERERKGTKKKKLVRIYSMYFYFIVMLNMVSLRKITAFTPAHTTATGVLANSVRSLDISKLSSAPLSIKHYFTSNGPCLQILGL